MLVEKIWSGRGDSNPRLQLGKLSYYPYTTAAQTGKTWSKSFIARPSGRHKARANFDHARMQRSGIESAARKIRLVDFEDASRFDDRRFFLAVRKASRTLSVNIDPGEFLSVAIIHRHLPVPVFPSAVTSESSCALLRFCRGFLLHRIS